MLKRRIETNLSALEQVNRMRRREVRAFTDAADDGRLRARRLVEEARATRRAARRVKAVELADAVEAADAVEPAAWDRRKEQIRDRVAKALERSELRTPDQVLEDLGRLVERRAEKEPGEARASVVVRAPDAAEKDVRAQIEALPGGSALAGAGLEVRPLAVGESEAEHFEIVLPVAAHALRREILNVSWALGRSGAFDAAWPGRSRVQIFDGGATTHATRVPPTFAWHMDMIRGRQAHEREPGHPDGARLGEGSRIVHPDTGWARHPEYNEDRIDKDASRDLEAEPDEAGGESATHSVRLLDKDQPNVTHGTATGSLMVGGPPSERPDIATLTDDELKLDRKPQVKEGHILGVAPAATVVPIRFISEDWELPSRGVVRLSDAHFVEFLDYAVSIGADVVSLSVGGMLSDVVRDAFENAIRNEDLIVVAATGQTYAWNIISRLSPNDSVAEPARFRDVIAVAGSSPDGRPWDESHRGPNVDITAPSDAVWVAEFSETEANDAGERLPILRPGSGTSFGTAVTAGAAALWVAHWGGRARLKETYPDTPLAWVFREVLQRTANQTAESWDRDMFGPGVIDLEAMLAEPLPPPGEVPEPPDTVANLLSWLEPGLRTLQELMDWLGERWAEAGAAAGAGATLVAGLVEGALDTAEGMLAEAYTFADSAAEGLTDLAGDAVAGGEQLVVELANAAEDAGEAVAGLGAEVVEEVGEFVEEGAETVGEAVNEVASWFGL